MPETAAKTTTPRARRSNTTKSATPKTATTPKAATSAPTTTAPDDGMARFPFVCEADGETKSYAKFKPPAASGCVGTLYVPLGTEEVKVLLIGPADVVEGE